MPKPESVSAYIAAAPAPARKMLKELRSAVRAAAPGAEERISYGMPYYHYRGRLVYFAAFKQHISLFIWGPVLKMYAAEVKPYRKTKATLHFAIGTRVPIALVRKLVTARRKENEALLKRKR